MGDLPSGAPRAVAARRGIRRRQRLALGGRDGRDRVRVRAGRTAGGFPPRGSRRLSPLQVEEAAAQPPLWVLSEERSYFCPGWSGRCPRGGLRETAHLVGSAR